MRLRQLSHAIRRRFPSIGVADIFVGDLRAPEPLMARDERIRIAHCRTESEPAFDGIAQIVGTLGVSRARCARDFGSGGLEGTVVYRRNDEADHWRPTAISCSVTGRRAIPEIGTTFLGGEENTYLFGDYVLPRFRRQGI